MAGYQIYRGVCDRGFLYVPGIIHEKDKEGRIVTKGESRYHCDMTLVGDVPLGDANAMWAADGSIWFDDYSVPQGSPVCYGYWVRAYDLAGNLYDGSNGCPRPGEYLCTRLREKTPPPVPVMTGLRARNDAVLVEWMSSPVQDLRAFHVYRSDAELDPPRFLACVFTDGTVSRTPWKGLVPSLRRRARRTRPARSARLLPRRHRRAAPPVLVPHLGARLARQRERRVDHRGHPVEQHVHLHQRPAADTRRAGAGRTGHAWTAGSTSRWGPAYDAAALQGFVVFRATVGDSVPAGVRDPGGERVHRPHGQARCRLPLLRPVDRPHRLVVPTLATGPSPVLTDTGKADHMGILDEFNPRRDGWFFENWGEAADFDWDLYRRTYLAINPTNDPIESPLDVAFFQIFKGCAANGNCGGMSMLALALFKYGGYLGYGSPANFYTGAGSGPDRADLHQAVNIMQARQFSAAGIRNFLDVIKAGELNDGFAAWNRIRSGLASGDYCMLSLSNGLFGDAAHTIIPYRADMMGSSRVLHVWDPNRPYDAFSQHYDGDHNKIIINGPTTWSYDQNAGGLFTGGTLYDGSMNGWFFAIPTSLEIHKGRQPISAGFVLTGLTTLFVSGIGAGRHPDPGRPGTPPLLERHDAPQPRRPRDVQRAPAHRRRAVAVAGRTRRRPPGRAVLPRAAARAAPC